MSFLYPSFLWALSVLSIPVIIHLFNFRRTQRIYFSTNRFLKQVQEATTAKRKLKHYLILASRLLFLLFLVLAFAQPIIPATEQFTTNRNVSIYLDNSLSMSVPVQEKSRALDTGIEYARQLVEALPGDIRYCLLTNDFAPFSNTYKSKNEILDLLGQVRLSPVSRTMAEVKERFFTRNSVEHSNEVFWISDFQKSTLGTISPSLYDSTQRWHIAAIAHQNSPNVFVDSMFLENPFVVGGEKNTVHVRLRNDGDKEVEQLLIKLTINGIQAGTSSVTIAGKGVTETSFDLTTGLTGISKASISFNDYPVSFDNEFFMALNFSDKIRIIEITPTVTGTAIEKVFGNRHVFTFHSYPVNNFNYSLLSQTDLVVLNGLDRIDASLNQSLLAFVQSGGSLLLIPSASPDLGSYNVLIPTGLTLSKPGALAELDYPDFSNPFFENVFEERTTRIAMPVATGVLEWGMDRSALLKFKNGRAFLSEFSQKGHVFLIASPLTNEFTSFHNTALFVPIMYRIAAKGKKNTYKPYYSLTTPFIYFRFDSLVSDQPLKLVGKQEIIPSQRILGNEVMMELPRFSMQSGFYKIVNQRDTVGVLAFNQSAAESMLAQLSAEEVKQQLGNAPGIIIFKSNTGEAFSNEIKARYLGVPLWKHALILALVFLMAEVLLIRFFK